MRIFVAGGAGYVGSRLVPELLKKGHDVIVFDLYLYGDTLLDKRSEAIQIKMIKGSL